MCSLVARESLLRKLSFPRLVIPTSATLTAAITFGVNLVVVARLRRLERRSRRSSSWLLLVPLLLELYVFILGVALDPRDAVRPLPRHRPGLGARAPAPLLRHADHLPDRLPAAVGAQRSRS